MSNDKETMHLLATFLQDKETTKASKDNITRVKQMTGREPIPSNAPSETTLFYLRTLQQHGWRYSNTIGRKHSTQWYRLIHPACTIHRYIYISIVQSILRCGKGFDVSRIYDLEQLIEYTKEGIAALAAEQTIGTQNYDSLLPSNHIAERTRLEQLERNIKRQEDIDAAIFLGIDPKDV